jgi:hypothetical protein
METHKEGLVSKVNGRPRKELIWSEVDKLCGIHATRREIADWFECSEDTVDRRCIEEFGITFAAYYEQKKTPGKISLRRKQYDTAMSGNIAMLIWLGKQWLGQTDKSEIDSTVNVIEVKLAYKD